MLAFVLLVLGQAKTPVVVAVRAAVPATVGGTLVPRVGAPGTAMNHALAVVATCPGTAVTQRIRITVVPTILDPLPHVAVHNPGSQSP